MKKKAAKKPAPKAAKPAGKPMEMGKMKMPKMAVKGKY